MRPTAILPVLCTIGALVLAFLCIFAGNKPGFMENYDILTVRLTTLPIA